MVDWRGRRQSRHIEDRRQQGSQGRFRWPRHRGQRAFARSGLGMIVLVVILAIGFVVGVDPKVLMNILQTQLGNPTQQVPAQTNPSANDEMKQFVAVIVADTEQTWKTLLQAQGKRYQEPTVVLYEDSVHSACGFQKAAIGPFYCPADRKVYFDLSFFEELETQLNAPGDFAQAYVIAHEIGHHVQNQLLITNKVAQLKRGQPQAIKNKLSVLSELQADCFAGVWAHHAERGRNLLEQGDLAEGLGAASAIGDDRLQGINTNTQTMPETFTHGSSLQRQEWFLEGYNKGQISSCNTFEETAVNAILQGR